MSAGQAALVTLAATLAGWQLARATAARRGTTLGTLPLPAAVAAAGAAALGAPGAAHPAAIALADALVAVAAVVDLRTGAIYDTLTATLAAAGALLAAADGRLAGALAGAAAVGGALLGLHLVTRGRGLGLGDVKLGAATGAALGPVAAAVALGAAFVAGGAYGAWLLAARRARRGATVPFAPFVALGTWAAGAGHVVGSVPW